MPAWEKVAVVSTWEALPKVTVPGPESLVQVVVTDPGGLGSPSSLTVPLRLAASGIVTVRLGPASTDGAVFAGSEIVITCVAESESASPSVTVNVTV